VGSEWCSIIYANSEDRNREYKASFPWERSTDGKTMAKVTKTILAMSNLRDGGHIVIGVDELPNGEYKPTGMQKSHLATYSYDIIADFVKEYAEPAAEFHFDIVRVSGMSFVILSVSGFLDVPVICRKSYSDILSESVVYVRPRSGRPRSAPLTNYVDMRELLDLATQRGVKRYLEAMARVYPASNNDQRLFEQELEGFGS